MRRSRYLLLPTVLISLLVLASCGDTETPTDPTDAVAPAFGKFSGDQDATALRIQALIEAVYPTPGLENAALNRWANLQRQLSRGQVDDAQDMARALVEQLVGFAAEGRLDAPDDPLLPTTLDGAVAELASRLFVFVGLEVADALAEFGDGLPDDFGVGDVDPENGGTIVTGNQWAAVIAPPGAVEEETYVTIELLDEETCATAEPLVQARGCWDINRYPEGDFGEDVTVEICVADNPAMTDEEWDLLLLHHKSDNGDVSALPWAEPTTIDCTGFGAEAPQQTASLSPMEKLIHAVGTRAADLFLPQPLMAAIPGARPPMGVGGTTGSFSDFFAAVPAGAQPDIVSWWPADEHYFDMYGGSHGQPVGNVSFVTPAISGSAFRFDGDASDITLYPLSQEVRDLQQLTVATWVNLDPAGSPHTIQRFLTLSPEKVVLRQEGAVFRYRMLHLYMAFEGEEEFRHIRVNDAFQTGCYHFFAGTYDGQTMRAYLDGVEVGSEPVPGGVVTQAAEDGAFSSTVEPLTGSIDETMIFNRALSIEEIQDIYDAGGTGKCVPQPGVTVYGMVRYSYWRLPGIQVELIGPDLDGPVLETTTTGAYGTYSFSSVPPGDYHVKVYGGGEYGDWLAESMVVGDEAVYHPVQLAKDILLLDPEDAASVHSLHPTLTWTGNDEADVDGGWYTVQINESDPWNAVEDPATVTGHSYTVQTALTPGTNYTWQVDAYDWRGRWVGTTRTPFNFTVSNSLLIDFEQLGDGTPVESLVTPIDLTTQYADWGLLVSYDRPIGDPVEASICDAALTARLGEGVNHSATANGSGDPCGGWKSGTMTMSFPGHPNTVTFRVRGPRDLGPSYPNEPFPITAFDALGNDITSQIVLSGVSEYDPPSRSNTWREETWIVTTGAAGVASVVVSHIGRVLMIDDLWIGP